MIELSVIYAYSFLKVLFDALPPNSSHSVNTRSRMYFAFSELGIIPILTFGL